MIALTDVLTRVCREIEEEGGRPFLVGGCVRDDLLGVPCGDLDSEVHGLNPEALKTILARHGAVNEVGASFGILKMGGADFSLPRRDNKVSEGHRGFEVSCDQDIDLAEASSRRDFTINSLMMDAITGQLYDCHGGLGDLHAKLLRPTSDKFGEDPLRGLRGMQFAARFDLSAAPEQESLGRIEAAADEYHTLPRERVFQEWVKWAMSDHPATGLFFLADTGWLRVYPCLDNLWGLKQSPIHHPEGCVLTHTMMVCAAMANVCKREGVEGEDRIVLMLAALLHDVGKVSTTVYERGDWRSPGHDKAGVPIAEAFLQDIGCFPRITERVLPLISEHMIPVWIPLSKRASRRLVRRLQPATLQELHHLLEADNSGRHPLPPGPPEGADQLLRMVEDEVPNQTVPILQGRHLLKLGWKPGPDLGRVLKAADEAQLDGAFSDLDGAIAWVNREVAVE